MAEDAADRSELAHTVSRLSCEQAQEYLGVRTRGGMPFCECDLKKRCCILRAASGVPSCALIIIIVRCVRITHHCSMAEFKNNHETTTDDRREQDRKHEAEEEVEDDEKGGGEGGRGGRGGGGEEEAGLLACPAYVRT